MRNEKLWCRLRRRIIIRALSSEEARAVPFPLFASLHSAPSFFLSKSNPLCRASIWVLTGRGNPSGPSGHLHLHKGGYVCSFYGTQFHRRNMFCSPPQVGENPKRGIIPLFGRFKGGVQRRGIRNPLLWVFLWDSKPVSLDAKKWVLNTSIPYISVWRSNDGILHRSTVQDDIRF